MYSARELVDAIDHISNQKRIYCMQRDCPDRWAIIDITRVIDDQEIWSEEFHDNTSKKQALLEMEIQLKIIKMQLALDHLKEKNDDK